jgi:hypothetical protein
LLTGGCDTKKGNAAACGEPLYGMYQLSRFVVP